MGVMFNNVNGGNPSSSAQGIKNKPKEADNPIVAKRNGVVLPTPKVIFFSQANVKLGYKQPRHAGAGMFNVGNTCYLNSTLQALFHTPALFNYLMSNNHVSNCKSTHNCIVCSLGLTLRESLSSKVIRPRRIYEKLKSICKHLIHGRQEDAHEFLRYLIEALQRSYLQSSTTAIKSLDSASKETTPFNQIFGGYMRQDVTCLRCKHVSTTFQHFMDLLLDIRQVSNIEDALQFHFRPEKIGGDRPDSMYKCEKCRARVPAKKQSFMERAPAVLCIQLKRFNLFGGKINKSVQLSRTIDMTQFTKSKTDVQYKLVSMITHMGSSPNCGHYTAIGEAISGQFFQFDDCSVRPISVGQALNTACYIVFYEMTQASWDRRLQRAPSTDGLKKPVIIPIISKPAALVSNKKPEVIPTKSDSPKKTNQPQIIQSEKLANGTCKQKKSETANPKPPSKEHVSNSSESVKSLNGASTTSVKIEKKNGTVTSLKQACQMNSNGNSEVSESKKAKFTFSSPVSVKSSSFVGKKNCSSNLKCNLQSDAVSENQKSSGLKSSPAIGKQNGFQSPLSEEASKSSSKSISGVSSNKKAKFIFSSSVTLKSSLEKKNDSESTLKDVYKFKSDVGASKNKKSKIESNLTSSVCKNTICRSSTGTWMVSPVKNHHSSNSSDDSSSSSSSVWIITPALLPPTSQQRWCGSSKVCSTSAWTVTPAVKRPLSIKAQGGPQGKKVRL